MDDRLFPKTFRKGGRRASAAARRVAAPAPAPAPGAAGSEAGPLFSREGEVRGQGLEAREGEVLRVTYENDDTGFRVLRVAVDGGIDDETWVGVFPPASPGSKVRATGKASFDSRHGPQFKVETILVVAPDTIAGLERYLGSGVIHGIGPAYAKRIVEAFGERTLETLDSAPDRLREVPGLGPKRAEAVIKSWAAHRAIGAIMIFLQAHGASPSLAGRIFKRFGPRAIDIVSRSPYRLALDVWGIGFKTADRIARSVGIAPDAPERAQAGVLQTLFDDASQGHVFALESDLCERAGQMLEIDPEKVREAVSGLALSGHVRAEPLDLAGDPRERAIFSADLFEAEARLAERLRALAGERSEASEGDGGPRARDAQKLGLAGGPERGKGRAKPGAPPPPDLGPLALAAIEGFEAKTGLELAPAQREAVLAAARHRILVLTGGPGVGKTTIVRAVLALFDRAGLGVRLAAPTGRAAKRMSEATGREALTLHRLLEFDPKSRGFQRGERKPIECEALVIDESSMIDLPLADALLQAVPDGARLILVGDVDQLPSVGPGAVLRDVITSGAVPTVRLTQIFRQAEGSLIVKNAHRIHEGDLPESARGKDGEFYVIERTDAEGAASAIQELVTTRIPQRFGLDPVRDVQVLTPMNRGPSGAIALNAALQAALNPSGPAVTRGQRTLRLGDKVMQLKNDYDREVYNGDVGIICAIDEEARTLTARFYDREVAYEESDLDELGLAYATSIHKSQGSEYPAVVIPFLTQHFVMLSRNLLYTAVTRGKRLVVLVADPRAIALALAETRKEERRTRLSERLRRAPEPKGSGRTT